MFEEECAVTAAALRAAAACVDSSSMQLLVRAPGIQRAELDRRDQGGQVLLPC